MSGVCGQTNGPDNTVGVGKPVDNISIRTYLMTKVNSFIEFLLKTKPAAVLSIRQEIEKMRSYESVCAIVIQNRQQFEMNPKDTILTFTERCGLCQGAFSKDEWSRIQNDVTNIMRFVIKEILNQPRSIVVKK